MTRQPEYRNIFQHLVENYDMPAKPSVKENFWVNDLEENQYKRLDGPVNLDRTDFTTPEDAARCIEEFAKDAGADLVGFTEVKGSFVFKGAEVPQKYAVVLAMEMDYDTIETAPEPPSGVEALRIYWRLGQVVQQVAGFIRSLGYPAVGHQVRTFIKDPPTILNPVAAYEAGLGEFGRLGVLITREFGPRVRLGTITTDLFLPQNERADFGVDWFCEHCNICEEACQGDAIPAEKREERGHMKYTIDPYKCLPQFAKYDGCNECVAVCPFNMPREELRDFIERLGY